MWCFRPRICQSNNLFIFCSLLLAAGFMLQMKVLYNNHQKQLRLQEYNSRISEVRESMSTVERVANVTNVLMKRLQMASKMNKKKYRKHRVS